MFYKNILNKHFLITSLLLFIGNNLSAENYRFEVVLYSLDKAILDFLNGEPEAFKSFWLHNEDITIAGGFGGKIEKGWDAIGDRLDRVNAVYEKAEFSTERISYGTSNNLGYLIQHEYIKYYGSGNTVQSERNYRVTMIFRLEEDGWKLIHRHADASMNWEPPK